MSVRFAAAITAFVAGSVCAQPAYTPPPPATAKAESLTSRSIMFDTKAADVERARQQGIYVESITVQGRDPDAPRVPRKPFEQRFAEALLRPAPTAGARMFDTTPCMSVQSSWNNIGESYAPMFGCPK